MDQTTDATRELWRRFDETLGNPLDSEVAEVLVVADLGAANR